MTNKLEEVFKELQESHVLVEKVKVPKFIADWIETWKGDGRTILHAMSAAEYEVTKYNNPVGKWLTGGRITEQDIKNQMIFVSAWLNGYEIEEEKRKFEVGEYYVCEDTVFKVTRLGSLYHTMISYDKDLITLRKLFMFLMSQKRSPIWNYVE